MLETRDVFAKDVKLDVDLGADRDVVEVCVLPRIRDDGDRERVVGGRDYRQRYAVDRH